MPPTVLSIGFVQRGRMKKGRLIRVVKPFGNTRGVGYIVALSDPARATARVREQAAALEDKVEDVCGVSGALIQWLNVPPGDFVCLDPKIYGASRHH